MTMECYYSECPHHGCNDTPPEEGPFCFENQCRALKSDIAKWDLKRTQDAMQKVNPCTRYTAGPKDFP